MNELLDVSRIAPISLSSLGLQMLVGFFVAMLIRWHYSRFGLVLSNRDELGLVFPFVLLTTILIITVVKSSLALSLGLVGALSIVRFRTPIKEPEELAYLFLSIACGLGLGAGQLAPTLMAALVILAVMAGIKQVRMGQQGKNLYLTLSLDGEAAADGSLLATISELVSGHMDVTDLRRFDSGPDSSDIGYFVSVSDPDKLAALAVALRGRYPNLSLTFIDEPRTMAL